LLVSHAYTETGTYTVTFTATDSCAYAVERTVVLQVESDTFTIYLPLVTKQ